MFSIPDMIKHQDNRNVDGWTGIVGIEAGYYHTPGIRQDGAVVAAGDNSKGQCDVSGWTDIVAVSATQTVSVGLRGDGRVVTAGQSEYGQTDVSGWTDNVAVGYSEDGYFNDVFGWTGVGFPGT